VTKPTAMKRTSPVHPWAPPATAGTDSLAGWPLSHRLATMENPVVHFEILGSDGPALTDFYRGLFGWPLQDTPLPGWPSYAIMEPPAGGIGGAVGVSDAAPNGAVVIYVDVDDIDQTLSRAVSMGASVALPVTSVGGTGLSVAWLRDPQGNVIGLVKRSQH
jgi:uncharacterized protein